ncbi:hypothetical protein CAEBREN_22613 [Caenorhabditis brenneri]|uniref:Serpentine receptor class gamma n=1 Tax=Caenorhabditis brenneri TaxID=135651 RepID=G0MEC7_CAEBE|nr:hypothetical protein CAEBREN_22613 [Caenorhabditis brenneri]
MTCVILPMRHEKIWKSILYPCLVLLYVIPLDTTWLIVMARVYINPVSFGFSVNYKEIEGLPKLSLIHLIECTIGFGSVMIFFIVTLIGLTTLEYRLKSAEKSLTFVTMVMAFQTLVFASTQIYFAFFVSFLPEIRQTILLTIPFISDSITVFSPVGLVLTNGKLKADVFNFSQLRGSRSGSMTQPQSMVRINSRVNIL